MNGAENGQLCGCCAGITQETPEVITNRPALSTIAFRVGTHATFNASMLADLSGSAFPALLQLRTRDPSDFSIALLDAWAVALDILTFYQERFANEAFIRTAVDQRSVFEIVRLVGYVPSPGVAASAILAFTLASAPGSPDNVLIPAGTRVQSVPGPGQAPQVFETSADLTALIAYNALPAQTTAAWQLFGSDTSTWIGGTTNNISVGDALLFVKATSGQPSLTGPGDVRYVTAVTIDAEAKNTQIEWDTPLSSAFGAGTTADQCCIYVFRKKAALYGVQAPNPMLLSGKYVSDIGGYPTTPAPGSDWTFTTGYADGSYELNLDASYPGLAPQSGGPPQWLILTGETYTSFFQITKAVDSSPGRFALATKTTQLTLAFGQILTGDTSLTLDEVLYLFVEETRNITAYVQSSVLTAAPLPITQWSLDGTYTKQTGMAAPVEGTSIVVSGGQQIAANQPIGVSGKRLRLQVLDGSAATFIPAGSNAQLPVAPDQTFLIDAFPPTPSANGNPIWTVLTASGVPGSLAVAAANLMLLPSASTDPTVGEVAIVQSPSPNGDTNALTLTQALARIYDATTVRVNANAVTSTNGETVQEILGSGDASNDALQFTLKQAPLTYLSVPTAQGAQSTLQVWVNNLQWHEVPSLLTAGAADRVFVTRPSPTGSVVVQFGNGVEGERTPTGQSNIRAVYRKGIGTGGMVAAGQLSQPLDRPQGVQSVSNPGPAAGAADPATPNQARSSAALPTLTMGRVVSLEDYQNFAIAFAGVTKAIATWTWFGNVRGIFLTLAGADGSTLQPDDETCVNLTQALRADGNPYVPLQLASYVPVLFQFTANVNVDTVNYDPNQVLASVWQAVSQAFAFEQMQLGQSVAASQIVNLIQQVPGVIALQLQALNLSGQPAGTPVPIVLTAAGPNPPAGAQLLVLDPATQGNIGVWG
jgi:hypothetical protein